MLSLRFLIVFFGVFAYHHQICGESAWDSSKYMATKTTYFKHPLSPAHDAVSVDANITEGFKVIHLDALYRHGTRYPGTNKLKTWNSLLHTLASTDPSDNINNILKSWKELFPYERNDTLHDLGRKELQFLAEQSIKQSGALYSEIFHLPGKNEHKDFTFRVYSTFKERTKTSAGVFVSYLNCYYIENDRGRKHFDKCSESKLVQDEFTDGNITFGNISKKIEIDITTLRPFDNCDKYRDRVKENENASVEVQKFFNSSEFQDVKLSVSKYFDGIVLSSKEVYSLYQLCSFLLGLYNNTVLCNYFRNQDIKIMEYASDLTHYYKTGYGYPINYQLSCKLFRDILTNMKQVKNGVLTGPSVELRFGHAETLIPLLCLLGLYDDKIPLTANSFDIHRDHRLFRTGRFSPFAGHVTFALFQSVQDSSLKLGVVVSGQYIKLPTCDFYLCDLNTVLKYFKRIEARFNCNTVCRNDEDKVCRDDEDKVYRNDEDKVYRNDEDKVYRNDEDKVYRNDEDKVYRNDEDKVYRNVTVKHDEL